MMNPKKIETLLLEGTPFGLRFHDLANWNGRIFVTPRASFNELLKRTELSRSGVYFLIGNDETTNRLKVYIGEADVLNSRLYSHNSKDFWNEVIVVVSKDESLDKASVRYMESVLVKRSKDDKQCDLENGNVPVIKNLSEANIAVMDQFIENTIFMLSTLGYRIIRYATSSNEKVVDNMMFCKGPDTDARGMETDEGFIVFKGSLARIGKNSSDETNGNNLLTKLLENGVLQKSTENPNSYVFTQDYVFSSPSAASGFVLARSSNGRLDWQDKSGIKLKQLQEVSI